VRFPNWGPYEETFNILRDRLVPVDQKKALIRKCCLLDRYFLAYFLGYDDQKHQWDEMHFWIVRRALPRYQRMPGRRVLWLMPRGTYKTAILHEVDCLSRILNDPTIRIHVGSWRDGAAIGISKNVRKHLENDELRWVFPDILFEKPLRDAEKWTEREFTVNRGHVATKDSTLLAFSIESLPTGKHCDLLKVDDIVEATSVQTEDAILKVKRLAQDLPNLLTTDESQIDATGTIWDPEDLYHDWIANPYWIIERHPAIVEDPAIHTDSEIPAAIPPLPGYPPGALLFPYSKSEKKLDQDRHTMHRLHFSGQVLLRMDEVEDSVWTKEQVRNYFDLDEIGSSYYAYHIVDLATEGGEDESVVLTGVVTPDGFFRIVSGFAGHFPPEQTAQLLYEEYDEWGGHAFIEEVGLSQYFDDILHRVSVEKGYKIPNTPVKSRHESKYARVWRLDPFYLQGLLKTRNPNDPDMDPRHREFFENYERQATRWPVTKLKDILDCCADFCRFGVVPGRRKPNPLATLMRRDHLNRNRRKQRLVLR